MGLYERLLGRDDAGERIEEPTLNQHAFAGALGQLERGETTVAAIAAAFGLDAAEQAELATLAARLTTPSDTISIGGYALVTNVGAAYDAVGPSKGLGIARVDLTGVSALEFEARWQKVAAGASTLSWQLWSQNGAGSELAIINDAAAAGDNRTAVVVAEFNKPTKPSISGVHTLRVRAKSTVAADDPVFYGATVRVVRSVRLGADAIHGLILLALDESIPTLDTPSELRSRLTG